MLLVHQSMFIRIPLILVLVEDGLRDNVLNYSIKPVKVLILVVVEDGLREATNDEILSNVNYVLILVVVEDGLREQKMQCDDH